MQEALVSTLKELELADFASYDLCMQKKIVHHDSPYGTTRLFVLNEKLGEICVLTRTQVASEFTRTFHLLTPMPALRITSLLLSPTGNLLMLNTRTAVYLLDVTSQSKRTSERSTTKPLYTAFDVADYPELEKTHSAILRVRWHPRCKDVMVLLTSNSSLFYIQCYRSDGSREIRCAVLFQTGNLGILHNRLVDLTYDDSNPSDDEFSDDELSHTSYGRSRLDLDSALGMTCVDFDFGTVLSKYTVKSRYSGAEQNDCCLYVLCETGDVILVSGCLSVSSRSRLDCRLLQILPPSSDNYGEDFCSLLCLSSWTNPSLNTAVNSMEFPPDVLILANRDGRLFQGVVLHSVGKPAKEYHEAPALCLVDVVDLHLHESSAISENEPQTDASLLDTSKVHSSNEDLAAQPPSLVLEPSSISKPSISIDDDFLSLESSYPYTAYYVIHDSGIHLVRLPWLHNLFDWCQKLIENPLATKMDTTNCGRAGDWQSEVSHLLCAQLPIATRDRAFVQEIDGRFRLLALLELPLVNRLGFPLPSTLSFAASPSLLIVRAPLPNLETDRSDPGSLIQVIRLDPTEPPCKVNLDRRTSPDDDLSSKQERAKLTGVLPRSEFALQLRRLLRQEEIHLPLISALSLQSNLTQIQVIQFLVKTTETLRSGSLNRLIRARNFVEQYTARLQDCLSMQYTDACQLAAERQSLQSNAQILTDRHAIILERQEMLDKRLGALASRLAGLMDEPSKAEIAMHDEVIQLRNRLQKGLKSWFASLHSKQTEIAERLTLIEKARSTSSITEQKFGIEHELDKTRWDSISEMLRKQTLEIRTLVDTIKSIRSKTPIST